MHYIFQFRVAAFIESYRGGLDRDHGDSGDRTIMSEGHGKFIADPRVTNHGRVVEKIRDEIATWKKLGKSYRANPRITILIFALHVRDGELNDDEDGYTFIHNEVDFQESTHIDTPSMTPVTALSATIALAPLAPLAPKPVVMAEHVDESKSGIATCRHWAGFVSGQINSNCRFGDRCRFKHAL